MCLDIVVDSNFRLKKEGDYFVGWKVVKVERKKGKKRICCLYLSVKNNRIKWLKTNKWMDEKSYRTRNVNYDLITYTMDIFANNPSYQKGWHIFLNKTDADQYKQETRAYREESAVRKVYFRKVVANGYQQIRTYSCSKDIRTVVAKEMFIPE